MWLRELKEVAFPTAFSCAAAAWAIFPSDVIMAYLWAWLENQVVAAIKLVPLGQTEGQRILLKLGATAVEVAARAATLDDRELGSFAPRLAILSSVHETQYSRIFRS
jgi:urease accessory protein